MTRDGGRPWEVHEASYVAFGGAKRTLVPVVGAAADATDTLEAARARLHDVLERIASGEFPVRPFEPRWCRHCAYCSICRKDYLDDE